MALLDEFGSEKQQLSRAVTIKPKQYLLAHVVKIKIKVFCCFVTIFGKVCVLIFCIMY